MHRTHHGSSTTRRGVILLVMLGLLALFMLILVSYAMMTSSERRAALADSRGDQAGDEPAALLNQGIYQLIRGARNPNSAVGPHSLLEDIYGDREGIAGAISKVNPTHNQQSAHGQNRIGANPANLTQQGESGGQIIEIQGISFGLDRQPGFAGQDDDGDGLVDNAVPPNPSKFQNFGVGAVGSESAINNVNFPDFQLGNVPRDQTQPSDEPGQMGQPPKNPYVDNIEGYYAGRVLTMIDGKAARQSTRIIRWYSAQTLGWCMWIRPFPNGALPAVGDRFIINGRAFNGTGFGYNPGNQAPLNTLLNMSPSTLLGSGDNYEFALTPNPTDRFYRAFLKDRPADQSNKADVIYNKVGVDADEDYDAPDYNNLILAGRRWNANKGPLNANGVPQGMWEVHIPSFHRPELFYYWMNAKQQGGGQPRMPPSGGGQAITSWDQMPAGGPQDNGNRYRQRIMLRPDPQDQMLGKQWQRGMAEYSGNIYFDPVNGPWDVDNDNDGVPDSIWVDLGLPVQKNSLGQMYKPLFAVLCLDLDGRININAHGNSSHYAFYQQNNPAFVATDQNMPTATGTGQEVIFTNTNQTFQSQGGSTSNPPAPPTAHTSARPIQFFTLNDPPAPQSGHNQQPKSSSGTPMGVYDPGGPYSGTATPSGAPIGSGFSPAEINLAWILPTPGQSGATRVNIYRWMLEGRFPTSKEVTNNVFNFPPFPGRYGEVYLYNQKEQGQPVNMLSQGGGGAGGGGVPPIALFANNPSLIADPNLFGKVEQGNAMPSTALWPPRAGLTGFVSGTTNGGQLTFTGDDNYPVAPMATVQAPTHGALMLRGNGASETSGVLAPYVPPNGGKMPAVGYYGSPTDYHGRLLPGVDMRGTPIYNENIRVFPGSVPNSPGKYVPYLLPESVDDPCEIDLSDKAMRRSWFFGFDGLPYTNDTTSGIQEDYTYLVDVDAPFTPYELEILLRAYTDTDLPKSGTRIDYLGLDWAPSANRWRLTTESWDLPCPNLTATPEIALGLAGLGLTPSNLSVGDLLRGKIAQVYYIENNSYPNLQQVNQTVQLLLNPKDPHARLISPDLVLGLRMDLNKPFGNGADENNNGVVDDVAELQNNLERIWKNTAVDGSNGTIGLAFDANQDGKFVIANTPASTISEYYSRQQFAKQLYVLVMLLADYNYRCPLTQKPSQGGGQPTDAEPIRGTRDHQRLTSTRIAQWAANVVDFRDRDGMMTPFEFDAYPFLAIDPMTGKLGLPQGRPTWDVDDNPGTVDDANVGANGLRYRGLVWGMEYPDLLLTETAAFHDKRVADTKYDTGNNGGDTTKKINNGKDIDFDQVRVPEGSLFVELYATGRTNAANIHDPQLRYFPQELYDIQTQLSDGSYGGVNLAALAPADANNIRNPVWRLAITSMHLGRDMKTAAGQAGSPTTIHELIQDPYPISAGGAPPADYCPDTTSMRPEVMDLLQRQNAGATVPPATYNIERYVWFTNQVPTATNKSVSITGQSATYRWFPPNPANASLILAPGQYAVVGPHRVDANNTSSNITWLGYTDYANKNATLKWTPMEFNLTPGAATLFTGIINNGTPTLNYPTATQIRAPLPIPVGFTPAAAPVYAKTLGLNISEPAAGYSGATVKKPSFQYPGAPLLDGYADKSIPDNPFDSSKGNTNSILVAAAGTTATISQPGTYVDIRTIFLERLANPLLPWNPEPTFTNPTPAGYNANLQVNPYITIDWMPVDLTVFNGQTVSLSSGSPTTAGVQQYAENDGNTPTDYGPAWSSTLTKMRNYLRTDNLDLFLQSRQRGPRVVDGSLVAAAPNPAATLPAGLKFVSGQSNTTTFGSWGNGGGGNPNFGFEIPLWAAISDTPRFQAPISAPANYPHTFYHNCPTTLGYINDRYGTKAAPWINPNTLSQNGAYYQYVNAGTLNRYLGAPQRAAPWLAWHNRPYANNMELLLVPASSPSRLTTEFTYIMQNQQTLPWANTSISKEYSTDPSYQLGHFGPPLTAQNNPSQPRFTHQLWHSVYQNPLGGQSNPPFGHLFNFFACTPTTIPGQTAQVPAPNFHRLFELVQVPSRFSGTDDLLIGPKNNVNLFEAPSAAGSAAGAPDLTPFYVPFNRVSRFREPGRINLNTLADQDYTTVSGNHNYWTSNVWKAITDGFPNESFQPAQSNTNSQNATQDWMYWQKMQQSKMVGGYNPAIGGNITSIMPNSQILSAAAQHANLQNEPFPSFFPNVFRAYTNSYLVPRPSMQIFTPADTNLLRHASDSGHEPLFTFNMQTGSATLPVTSAVSHALDYRDSNRHAYFRYQPLIKLGSMTTTRSNVYAIWVTMGYFEVQAVPPDVMASDPQQKLRTPDGYILVRELGSDGGNITRHRAFCVVDRSIPVGFQRGENYNVDKTILVKRIIE